jgi:hypothetical protein
MLENFLRVRSAHLLLDPSDLCPYAEEDDQGIIPQEAPILFSSRGASCTVYLAEWLSQQSLMRLRKLQVRAPRAIADELARRRRTLIGLELRPLNPVPCLRSSRLGAFSL